VRTMYEELGVRSRTQDRNIINKALNQVSAISLINNEYIKLKNSVLRNKVLVKSIEKENEEDFKNLINEIYPNKDDIKSINYDSKFSTVTITMSDEETAKKLLHLLFDRKFKENYIDCSFQEENLYISMIQENQNQGRQKPFTNYPFNNSYGPMMMPPNPFYMNMNQVMNPFMPFPQSQPYRGGGGYFGGMDRRPYNNYNKGPGGDMGGNRPPYNKFRPNYEAGGQQQAPMQGGDFGGGAPFKRPFRKFAKRGGGPGSYINKNNGSYGRFNNNNRYGGGRYPSNQKEDVVDDMTNFPPLNDS